LRGLVDRRLIALFNQIIDDLSNRGLDRFSLRSIKCTSRDVVLGEPQPGQRDVIIIT
jgi:hypothetical protein